MDLSIYAKGNGSDTEFDLTDGLFNYVYLYLFGGNIEEDTPETPTAGKFRNDYWANGLFNTELQFNSTTERALLENAITSQGLENIRNAIVFDLKGLKDLAEIDVDLISSNVDKLEINVSLKEPDSDQLQTFNFIWDATRSELIEKRIL
jgi:hypothetical protein